MAESGLVDFHNRLRAHYGAPPKYHRLDPVTTLILALLGTRTPSPIAKQVVETLALRFGTWEAVRDAPAATILRVIRPVTYAEKKVVWLPDALRAITRQRGRLELNFLAAWPEEAASAWLRRLPGVGAKVSAAVLNFSSLRKRMLVVDSHHLRVAKRLGLIAAKAGIATAARRLSRQLPNHWTADDLDDHHTLMKHHGQQRCGFWSMRCHGCPLSGSCRSGPTDSHTATVEVQGS